MNSTLNVYKEAVKALKAAGQDNWKKEKDFLDMMKKRFDEKGGWRVPRE